MKQIFIITLLVVAMLYSGSLWAAESKKSAVGAREIRVKDKNGREVTIETPVNRIVALTPGSALSAIRALQAEKKVVGVLETITKLGVRFPVFSKLPAVSTTETPNYEDILALNPDLVIASYWMPEALEEKLEPAIPVVRLDIGPPETYAAELKTLAAILEEEELAQELIDWYQGHVKNITQRLHGITDAEKPAVFDFYGGEYGTSAGPPYGTYGKDNSWVTPTLKMAGGRNLSGEIFGDWILVDPEWVITQNPDIIIREVFSTVSGADVVGYEASDTEKISKIWDELVNESALNFTNAVKDKKVYIIGGALIQEEWFLGLQYLARWFHPERFADIDPQAIHQEFLHRFQRLDYDLSEQGVFVYPVKEKHL